MAVTKPTFYPDNTSIGDATDITLTQADMSGTIRNTGYASNAVPSHQEFNEFFKEFTKWTKWTDSILNQLADTAIRIQTSDVTVQQNGTAKIVKSNSLVSIMIPAMSGTSNSTELYLVTPSGYWPFSISSDIFVPCSAINNGGLVPALVQIMSNGLLFYTISSGFFGNTNFTNSGTKGFLAQTISFIPE